MLSKRIDLAETVLAQNGTTTNHLSSDPFSRSSLKNEFYGRRSDPFENQLMREFTSPNIETKKLIRTFKIV